MTYTINLINRQIGLSAIALLLGDSVLLPVIGGKPPMTEETRRGLRRDDKERALRRAARALKR